MDTRRWPGLSALKICAMLSIYLAPRWALAQAAPPSPDPSQAPPQPGQYPGAQQPYQNPPQQPGAPPPNGGAAPYDGQQPYGGQQQYGNQPGQPYGNQPGQPYGSPPPPPPAYYPQPAPVFVMPVRFGGDGTFTLGLPTGNVVAGGAALGDTAAFMLQLEGGADLVILERIILGFNIGLGYAPAATKLSDFCTASGTSCYGINFSLGLHAQVLLIPAGNPFVPWVGIEAGYEDLIISQSDGSVSDTFSYGGSQFEISAGLDLKLRNTSGWGPVIAYRFGKYTSSATSGDTVADSNADILNQSSHGWLMLGLRSRY